jgi:hypothetical protein
VFVVHGTADTADALTRALSIVDGATAAEISYEFYSLEDVGHSVMSGATTADGQAIDDAMYEFLNRVLYEE